MKGSQKMGENTVRKEAMLTGKKPLTKQMRKSTPIEVLGIGKKGLISAISMIVVLIDTKGGGPVIGITLLITSFHRWVGCICI